MSRLAYALTAALGAAAGFLGLRGMLGAAWTVALPALLPFGGLELAMDPLAGFFLALVGFGAVPASLAALEHAGSSRRGALAFPLFVLAMGVVPLAANVLSFLLAWELMSLASYVLVLHDRERESVGAAWAYAVMTHAGLACLLVGMLSMSVWTGSFRFADWTAAGATLPAWGPGLAFVLLGVGFGTKAGVIPLHVWLPRAHPAAPSHVSALMSGVMVKLGVYGLLRAGLEWLPGGAAWWGVLTMVTGALSAVVGVLYALVDRDLKRLLAFSTIENVGIILLALGSAMLFHTEGLEALALLSLAAGLYHVANHAAFKSLLFLGAGAVVHATGTRDMEAMGGLIKRMPWTAATFLTGALAIAALPPLNGFVSEWLVFQALLQNLKIARPALNLVYALGLAALALTGGLAVACFVRAFGITFLALPRGEAAARAHEAGPAARAAMAVLAVACLGLALGATALLPALGAVAAAIIGVPRPTGFGSWLALSVSAGFGTLSPLVVTGALATALALPAAVLALAGVSRRRRSYETWGCGRMVQTARMEYTATAFANPFKRVFDFFYRPVKQLDIEAHPDSRLFVGRIAYANPTRSIFEDWLYRPALRALHRGARWVRAIQSGSANLYLVYILAALLALLVLA
jgi:hydrogenase-4 component B